jgi:hypothetical protein
VRTTFLYHLLIRHPHVERAAKKELHYFDRHFDKGVEWYRRCFPSPSKDRRRSITGEATPYYLFHPQSPKRMAEIAPEARLIALLRNPVDRAYSHYHEQIRKGYETLSFERALEAEEARLHGERDKELEKKHYTGFNQQHFSYLSRGVYVDQLLRWSKFFGEKQILILKSEDFFERTPEILKLILNVLNLPDWEPATSEVPPPRNPGKYKRRMNPATRRRLEDYYELHNWRLYEYLGVDFGWGKAGASATSRRRISQGRMFQSTLGPR